jgi:hypothetical protein
MIGILPIVLLTLLFVVIVAPIAFVVLLIRAWPSSPAGDPLPLSQKKLAFLAAPSAGV